MSTDYMLVCYTCKKSMPGAFASGSIAYGYKMWDHEGVRKWLGDGEAVGHHEGHDLRIVSEHREARRFTGTVVWCNDGQVAIDIAEPDWDKFEKGETVEFVEVVK